jgi:cytochrome c oxidase subunit 1
MAGGNLFAGLLDQPAAETNYVGRGGTGFFNVCVAAGAIAVVILTIAGILLLVRGFTKGELAGDDPWEGHTLEWVTTSPPPDGTFTAPLPEITSDCPLSTCAKRPRRRDATPMMALPAPAPPGPGC